MILKQFLLIICATAALGGCAAMSLSARHDTARGIAQPAGLTERIIASGLFNLTTFERVTKKENSANVYIEGDGLAWLDKHTKSMNPTPPDPLTLRLAALDPADNVIYLARPCQYTGWNGTGACPDIYWSNGRTAPEVISAYQQALNDIKALHHITGFNLIGYSGGAAVAILVAARRTDVLSLRTVAGNTDYTAFSEIHQVSPLDLSLNPVDAAKKISALPQQHFIGEQDTIVPAAVSEGWKRASEKTNCIDVTPVPHATHEKGWTEQWRTLLNAPLACK